MVHSMISTMKLVRHRSNLVLSLVIVFVAFLGAAHILIRTSRYGIIISPDSLVYSRYAESIVSGDWSEGGLIWAPFLSMVLAFFRLFGVDPSDAGRFLNVIGFGLIILMAGHWLSRYVKFRLIVVCTAVAVMVSNPITAVSTYLLSDTLFILLTMLALVQMESYLSGRTVKSGFVLSIVFSAMVTLTRWLGVTVIFTGVILILTRRGSPTRIRCGYAVLYGIVSSVPLMLWLTRNWIISRTIFGERSALQSRQSVWDGLSQTGEVLHGYIFLYQKPGWLGICLWAAAVLIVLEAVKLFISRRSPVITLTKSQSPDDSNARTALPFVAFAIIYYVTLILIAPHTVSDGVTSRYLSPIYVPVLVTVALLLDRLLMMTYRHSGFLAWKNSDGWGLSYNRSFGPIAVTKWAIIGFIFAVFLGNFARNMTRWLDLMTTYNLAEYHL